MGFKGLNQFVESPNQVVVVQPVIDRGTLFASAHQVQPQQVVQVLLGRGCRQSHALGDLPCTQFICLWGILSHGRDKQFQDGAPARLTGRV